MKKQLSASRAIETELALAQFDVASETLEEMIYGSNSMASFHIYDRVSALKAAMWHDWWNGHHWRSTKDAFSERVSAAADTLETKLRLEAKQALEEEDSKRPGYRHPH